MLTQTTILPPAGLGPLGGLMIVVGPSLVLGALVLVAAVLLGVLTARALAARERPSLRLVDAGPSTGAGRRAA